MFLDQVVITFDGGSLGNPGKGYGSFVIDRSGVEGEAKRLEFSLNGEIVSNNQAEYRSLIAALQEAAEMAGPHRKQTQVVVQGDSKLVIEQLAGRWKVKNAGLIELHRIAKSLLQEFGGYTLTWHDRSKSVKRLGH